MEKRIGGRLAAACGALYVVLLVVGDDLINPAGEVPEADAPLREVSSYLEKADSSSFWLGRSIGLLGLCALLVFVVHVSREIRDERGPAGGLSGLVLVAGSVAVAMQLLAAPAQFAAVQGASAGLDPQVAQAHLHASASFQLSFIPLALFLGAVAAAGLLPRWLSIVGGLLSVGLIAGLVGQPQDPGAVAFMAFAFGLLWFVAASMVLVRRSRGPATARRRPSARRAAVVGGTFALVLASGLSACGEDDDDGQEISKELYIARSGAICTSNGNKAGAAFKRIVEGAPRTPATAERFLAGAVVPIFSDSVERRAKLPAPDGDEREIAAINNAGRQALAEFKRIAQTPSRSMALMRGRIPDPATDYDARSRRYGIAKCGGDQS